MTWVAFCDELKIMLLDKIKIYFLGMLGEDLW